eukprot:CAMPEP_0174736808 /NCGR_PEP_ID=MMETSP1094-20130205/67289_1 /TAXON_ID=156173 /ORGANISM="Chrysochromulina brevifilum, Strain UTEX LB 985" /LENGTH=93 /DNA_ID=CAMNT_0015939965 /DNA_START=1 /DNA_END=282 /DNA_ORIENTATION=+
MVTAMSGASSEGMSKKCKIKGSAAGRAGDTPTDVRGKEAGKEAKLSKAVSKAVKKGVSASRLQAFAKLRKEGKLLGKKVKASTANIPAADVVM